MYLQLNSNQVSKKSKSKNVKNFDSFRKYSLKFYNCYLLYDQSVVAISLAKQNI